MNNNTWNKVEEFKSSESTVTKFVFTKSDAVTETVLYKYPTYEDRTVICCSVESGCRVGCTFCGTGKFFNRSLSCDEIVDQVVHAVSSTGVASDKIKKFQIMLMSMGEIFHNYNNSKLALVKLNILYPNADLLVSTSAPKLIFKNFENFCELSKFIPKIGLQFSVHESTNETRKRLIPTPTCSLEDIMHLGERWNEATGRRPFFNYCVHEGNSSSNDAYLLNLRFNPKIWNATISVICEKDESVKAAHQRQKELTSKFSSYLLNFGYNTRVFNPAGVDAGSGCGQLWYVQKWAKEKGLLN